jgi:hypothetical protein
VKAANSVENIFGMMAAWCSSCSQASTDFETYALFQTVFNIDRKQQIRFILNPEQPKNNIGQNVIFCLVASIPFIFHSEKKGREETRPFFFVR